MKVAAVFLLGALLAGYAVWELKPSGVESLALGALARLAAEREAVARATYQAEQATARDALDAATAQLEVAHAARREAEAQTVAATQTARQARAQVADTEARVRHAQAATQQARLAAQDRPASRTALEAVVEAQAGEIEALTINVGRVRAGLTAVEHRLDVERAVSRALRAELVAATARTAIVEQQFDLAADRVAHLDGRRLRWGPGVTAGVSPVGRHAPGVVVGLTLLWG